MKRCGAKAVLLDGFQCLFIQAHSQPLDDLRIHRFPILIDDQRHHADALILGSSCLIGELRIDCVDKNGSHDSIANMIEPSPKSTALPGTESAPGAISDTATLSGADSSSAARSIGGQLNSCLLGHP